MYIYMKSEKIKKKLRNGDAGPTFNRHWVGVGL